METTKFEQLREKWIAQREKFQEWELGLIQHANHLKNELELALGVKGETWQDIESRNLTPYILFSNIDNKDTYMNMNIPHHSDCILPTGELVVGIQVTMDHSAKIFPKRKYNIPVAIKFINQEVEYSFWEIKGDQEVGNPTKWNKDLSEFIDQILKRLESSFTFDPKDGVMEKSSIGFIQN